MAFPVGRNPYVNGPLRKDIKTDHWLVYKSFGIVDENSGNEFIQVREEIGRAISEATDQLRAHGIEVANAWCQDMYDHRSFERLYKVAIGFASKEDLVMAKLVIKCEE
jgi:hypothetical protein